ncbi:MAG: GAF domain-containing protein [Hyphomicrobiales bacterium]|nr:MAG: GAF domain-containing protein [Hyphomicrobiales bacterium]
MAHPANLSACEDEPIHIPGSIQPHGALLVVDSATGTVLQAAVGDAALRQHWKRVEGAPVARLLAEGTSRPIDDLLALAPDDGSAHLALLNFDGARFQLVGHRRDDCLVLELERADEDEPVSLDAVYPHVRRFLETVQHAHAIDDLLQAAVEEIYGLTRLDRVLVYRFDADWNGEVIAERTNDRLPSYLGLHFPASDIPAQARDLYTRNRLRLIADANYTPAVITPPHNPRTGRPVDLTAAVLRSVSPVHLEYMRNMGTMASFSISLLREERLWGLISCHHRDPARVPYHVRTACDFIGQILSMQLAAKDAQARMEHRHALRAVQSRLLARMAGADHFVKGLLDGDQDLLSLANASGAAIVTGSEIEAIGEHPGIDAIHSIVHWLSRQRREDLFVTDRLAKVLPGAEHFKDTASGVLAISISQLHDRYVLWFRPEITRTITWGGEPGKLQAANPDSGRLHPRKSFAAWNEIVRLRSKPWDQVEIDATAELRTAIVDIVLRKAEETAALSERLTSINKELEAFSYSVSHDLRAPFRHIVGYAQLLKKHEGERLTERGDRYIATIVESAIAAGQLVDDLLSFSQMGRATLHEVAVDMKGLVESVRASLQVEGGREITWRIGALPVVRGDPMMLRLALQNLMDNAIKFTRDRPDPVISIAARREPGEIVFTVADNGIGFDMAYVGKLFGVFQRLHRPEEFQGTGIGLANVRRIIERHRGRTWAEGKLGEGAQFHFSLPIDNED